MKPRLIHPIPVVIRQINRGDTDYDTDFDEPTAETGYDDPVTLPGQVKYQTVEQAVTGGASWVKNSIGRIVFRRKDLEDRGITLKEMDKIISIEGRGVEYYILEARPQGHYRRSTLIFAFFRDKNPRL